MNSSSETPTYNLKAVVQETGLKPDTLRAWERRYGLPEPQRTESRHRLYSQKIVDYVLQDRRSGEIVALVELDDFTHRHRRDHARDVLTDIAGYRTIRLSAARRPTLASVRVAITQALA